MKNNFLLERLKEFGLKESALFDNTLVNLLLEKPSDSNISQILIWKSKVEWYIYHAVKGLKIFNPYFGNKQIYERV